MSEQKNNYINNIPCEGFRTQFRERNKEPGHVDGYIYPPKKYVGKIPMSFPLRSNTDVLKFVRLVTHTLSSEFLLSTKCAKSLMYFKFY